MNPETQQRLNNWGCLLSLVALIAGGVAAFLGHPKYLLPAFPIVLFWFFYTSAQRRAERRLEREAFAEAFRGFDGLEPKFKSESVYGWPSFTLTFDTKESLDLAEAQGRIAAFKAEILKLHGHIVQGERFDVDRAVFATYEGRFNFDHLEGQFPDLARRRAQLLARRSVAISPRLNHWAAVITGIGTVLGALVVGYLSQQGIWNGPLVAIYLLSVFCLLTFLAFTYGTKWIQVLWLITLALFLLGLAAALFSRNQNPEQPPANTGDRPSSARAP